MGTTYLKLYSQKDKIISGMWSINHFMYKLLQNGKNKPKLDLKE